MRIEAKQIVIEALEHLRPVWVIVADDDTTDDADMMYELCIDMLRKSLNADAKMIFQLPWRSRSKSKRARLFKSYGPYGDIVHMSATRTTISISAGRLAGFLKSYIYFRNKRAALRNEK